MIQVFKFARILLGLIFVVASMSKIFFPHDFATVIYNYQVLPGILVATTALIIPWLELVCGACLVFNILPKGATMILSGLMVVFVGLLSFNIYRGLNIACGCFTTNLESDANMFEALVRDSSILPLCILAIFGAFLDKRQPKAAKTKA